ncbi:MAG: SseB family protein [Deferrisomatales bacterium]|nr:SseB family protein [Deferrisomatales bacterium]
MVFIAENDLERSLVKATEDPSHHRQFYRDLLESEIHVIQHGPAMGQKGKVKRKKGRRIELQFIEADGEAYIPIFSSVARLQAFIDDQAKCLTLSASDLLKITRGSQLLLNPGSSVGKVFAPEEVAAILDGSIFSVLPG